MRIGGLFFESEVRGLEMSEDRLAALEALVAQQGAALRELQDEREIEDCFHNQRYLRLGRDYWGRRTQNRRACCSTAR